VNIPIVSLDKIYITPDEENIFFLDCTRVSGSDEIISRKGISIERQIERIVSALPSKEIVLADDVVFTGSVLRYIINKFKEKGISVVGIISSISMNESFNYFNSNLKYGLRTNFLLDDAVIDQVCERDFYFGIAGSGIMISDGDKMVKSPYFYPYGDPVGRASIKEEYASMFSKGCLERSIYLWEEIDKLKRLKTLISELPEAIINTNKNNEVVNTLRMELKRK